MDAGRDAWIAQTELDGWGLGVLVRSETDLEAMARTIGDAHEDDRLAVIIGPMWPSPRRALIGQIRRRGIDLRRTNRVDRALMRWGTKARLKRDFRTAPRVLFRALLWIVSPAHLVLRLVGRGHRFFVITNRGDCTARR